jgi:3-hydroxyacyl-CoA dehydrogenase
MRAGFGWQHGPFQIWDAVGVKKGIEMMKEEGYEPPPGSMKCWKPASESFYTVKDGNSYYYDIPQKKQVKVPGQDAFIILDNIRESKAVFKNSGVVVQDLGDGILNVEFRSKMNTIGGDVLDGLNKAIDLAEKEYQGLVVANSGTNFSVGANIGMIFMMAVEQEYDELNMAVNISRIP